MAPCTLQSHVGRRVGHRRIVPCACMSGACPVHDRVRDVASATHGAQCGWGAAGRASRSSGLVRAAQELLSSQMSQVTPEEARWRSARNEPVDVGVLASRAPFFTFTNYRIIRGNPPAMPRRRSARFGLRGRRAGRRAVRTPVTEARKSDREIVPILRRTGRPTWNVPGGGGPLRATATRYGAAAHAASAAGRSGCCHAARARGACVSRPCGPIDVVYWNTPGAGVPAESPCVVPSVLIPYTPRRSTPQKGSRAQLMTPEPSDTQTWNTGERILTYHYMYVVPGRDGCARTWDPL